MKSKRTLVFGVVLTIMGLAGNVYSQTPEENIEKVIEEMLLKEWNGGLKYSWLLYFDGNREGANFRNLAQRHLAELRFEYCYKNKNNPKKYKECMSAVEKGVFSALKKQRELEELPKEV